MRRQQRPSSSSSSALSTAGFKGCKSTRRHGQRPGSGKGPLCAVHAGGSGAPARATKRRVLGNHGRVIHVQHLSGAAVGARHGIFLSDAFARGELAAGKVERDWGGGGGYRCTCRCTNRGCIRAHRGRPRKRSLSTCSKRVLCSSPTWRGRRVAPSSGSCRAVPCRAVPCRACLLRPGPLNVGSKFSRILCFINRRKRTRTLWGETCGE